MSLYDDLGVPLDATAGQIRAAYRSLAQKLHPDKGGDHDEMQRVQNAYDVLGDPERRFQYDTEGTTGQVATAREKALAMVGGTLNQTLDTLADEVDVKDPIQEVRDQLHEALREGEEVQKSLARRIQARNKALRRLLFTGSDDVLAVMVRSQIAGLTHKMDQVEDVRVTARDALDLLASYDYRVDESPAPAPALPLGRASLDDLVAALTSGGKGPKYTW